MKVIAYTNDAGGVSIITPIANIEKVAKKDVPPIVLKRDENGIPTSTELRPYIIVNDSELPSYEFRGSWYIEGGKVLVHEHSL